MKTGAAGAAWPDHPASRRPAALQPTVPTIVFHGDHDPTVHPRNGERVIAAALHGADVGPPQLEQGVSAQGRHCTRAIHRVGHTGRPLAEHWVLHGSGHAWPGDRSAGSFTDAKGPDATAAMLLFFFQQARADAVRH